ncbi:MAG: hypothetical protein V5A29_12220 [Haloarculaceae archaeon]
MTNENPINQINLVTSKAAEQLNDEQIGVYRDHRTQLARWALSIGKDPLRGEGYAVETVKQRFYRLDLFYRFIWGEEDRLTVDVTTDHADAWMRELAYQNNTQTYNAACQKAVKMLFKWMRDDLHKEVQWDKEVREFRVDWIDWDECCIRSPGEFAVKSDKPWTAAVRSTTLSLLRRWIEERSGVEKKRTAL